MWLLVGAPTVSRVLPLLASGDAHAWCADHGHGDEHSSMAGMAGMDDMPGMPDMGSVPNKPDTPGDPMQHMDQCGYCALLSHTPLLSGGVVAVLLTAPLPASAPVMPANVSWHAQPLLSANPRGPPSILPG
jgi:hypothetical protein